MKRAYSRRRRAARARVFHELFPDAHRLSVLDLGGGDGSHIASVLPGHFDITVADVFAPELDAAWNRFGFETQLIPEHGPLPFDDGQFDLVFCSSVIEHVTGPKREMVNIRSEREFQARAWAHQSHFCDEIRRIGRGYFVQTPHKHFLVESHTNAPGLIMSLPREAQLAFWKLYPLTQHHPDFRLLTPFDMRGLFPDAELHFEKVLGMVKSIMAVKRVTATRGTAYGLPAATAV